MGARENGDKVFWVGNMLVGLLVVIGKWVGECDGLWEGINVGCIVG